MMDLDKEASLADRTLRALCDNDVFETNALQDPDAALEILNRAFLEAKADEVLYNCAPAKFDGRDYFTAFDANGDSEVHNGPLPPEGTIWTDPRSGCKFYISSHRGA